MTSLDLWDHYEEYADCQYVGRNAQSRDDLQKIANLIYLTDPYISGCFWNVKKAMRLLSKFISDNISIFGLNNINVVADGNTIVRIAIALCKI